MELSTLVEFNKILNPHKARLIRGPTGIGKSSIVKHLARLAGAKFVDIRLPELEPTDLVGLPYLEDRGNYKVTKYAQPDWWPTDPEEKVYLVLEELDRASEDMQPIAMQLCLDRRAGGRDLPDNVVVWAACNGEKYMTTPLDQALIDRFAVIDLSPTVDEWLDWAETNDVNALVIKFISAENSRLDTPINLIGKPNLVCPSRRSWAELGFLVNNIPVEQLQECNLTDYAETFVGEAEARAFSQWVKEKYKVLSPLDIMNGVAQPTDANILQVTSVIDQAVSIFMRKRTPKYQRKNCVKFFMGASNEVFAAFMAALPPQAGFIIEDIPDANKFLLSKKRELITKE